MDVLHADRRLPARVNQPLIPADQVQTWTNSRANLLWYGNVAFQVSELSEVVIPPPPGAEKHSTLEVINGIRPNNELDRLEFTPSSNIN